jgi:hypothetical protein
VLESVVVFRLAVGAVAEVVVSLGLAKAGFLFGCTVLDWASLLRLRKRSEDAYSFMRALARRAATLDTVKNTKRSRH